MAWQIFKFLVWPASSKQRGEADTSRKVTDMQGPRTFETFKADWETFLPKASEPKSWDAYPDMAGPCTNEPKIKPGELVLASFSKFGNIQEVDNTPGLTNVLVAQNWTYVRYLPAYGKDVFNKIVSQKLYNSDIVGEIGPALPGSPVPAVANQSSGALTVKSAWIELPKGNDRPGQHIDPSRFYIRHDAWLQDPQTGACSAATVGLVGLHIAFKTPSRPQWIWSTFEHIDNVPELDNVPEPGGPSGKIYTFNNGDRRTPMTNAPESMYTFPRPSGTPGPGVPPKPFQVERLQRISHVTSNANRDADTELGRLGSIWRYYKLVMTQWPSFPSAPDLDASRAFPMPFCSGRGGNAAVNTTMETFLQTNQHCDQELTCMGCHNGARTTDFVWSILVNPNSPLDSRRSPAPRIDALRKLQNVLHKSQPR